MKKSNPKNRRSARAIKAELQKLIVQPAQLQSAISEDSAVEPYIVAYDENLLECARLQWHMGDWIGLVKIDRSTLQHHPDRAKLALLVATAHQQTNQQQTAAHFVSLALDWGCSKKLIAQLLIAGVHNTLGRASALRSDKTKSEAYFRAAVASDAQSLGSVYLSQARALFELKDIEQNLSILRFENTIKNPPPLYASKQPVFNEPLTVREVDQKAYGFYQKLSEETVTNNAVKFILLDSKSIPRSGLHYLKNTFAKLLGNQFSFCEWYQEPGCCKKTPCALTGYAVHSDLTKYSKIRLIKSHDFELNDPAFTPINCVRRLILIRHPLFSLTSHFCLDLLSRHKEELHKQSINLEKIWLSHESEIVASAYEILERVFVEPDYDFLESWLKKSIEYYSKFNDKWIYPAIKNPKAYEYLVRYEEIDNFFLSFIKGLNENLTSESKEKVKEFAKNKEISFHPRRDPFMHPSERVSQYLKKNSMSFYSACQRIIDADKSGFLADIYSINPDTYLFEKTNTSGKSVIK